MWARQNWDDVQNNKKSLTRRRRTLISLFAPTSVMITLHSVEPRKVATARRTRSTCNNVFVFIVSTTLFLIRINRVVQFFGAKKELFRLLIGNKRNGLQLWVTTRDVSRSCPYSRDVSTTFNDVLMTSYDVLTPLTMCYNPLEPW